MIAVRGCLEDSTNTNTDTDTDTTTTTTTTNDNDNDNDTTTHTTTTTTNNNDDNHDNNIARLPGGLRDFKDTVYPFFESDTLFLELFVCAVFGCLAILRIEGCLNSTPNTLKIPRYSWIFLESPKDV